MALHDDIRFELEQAHALDIAAHEHRELLIKARAESPCRTVISANTVAAQMSDSQ